MRTLSLVLIFLLPIYALASDSIGDKERVFLETPPYQPPLDENGRPRITCRSKDTMLDQTGCLQADGKVAKHCAVIENFRPLPADIADPCGSGWKKSYLCHDYAICLKDEGAGSGERKKSSGGSEPKK